MPRFFLALGAASAFVSIALGAFAAHALKTVLSEHHLSVFQTAAQYQMTHSLALVALALFMSTEQNNHLVLKFTCWSWISGIALFSGSLYALCFSGISILGAITPMGGLAFLLGWGALFVFSIKRSS